MVEVVAQLSRDVRRTLQAHFDNAPQVPRYWSGATPLRRFQRVLEPTARVVAARFLAYTLGVDVVRAVQHRTSRVLRRTVRVSSR